MANIRRKLIHARMPLSPQLRRYLATGDYLSRPGEEQDFDTFLLAGQVIRGNIAGLVAAWTAHGAEILAGWPHRRTRPWAETKLGVLGMAGHSNHRNGGNEHLRRRRTPR